MSMTEENMRAKGYIEVPGKGWQKVPASKLDDAVQIEERAHKPVDRERDLHDQIEEELKRRRWYYVHSRTDRATTTAIGVPDFIIAAPDRLIYRGGGSDTQLATTYWIEVKRKGGKLSPEQNVARHLLTNLGHHHAVVYSMKEFLEVIK